MLRRTTLRLRRPEPAGETAEQAAERVRDEKGRFAAKAEEPEPVVAKEPVKAAEPVAKVEPAVAPVVDPLAPPAEPVKPPPGFSPTAKVVWDKETLSKDEWEAVKRDIAKRNDEVNKGFEKLAEYKPIKQYIEMARSPARRWTRRLRITSASSNEIAATSSAAFLASARTRASTRLPSQTRF
jgi:hypothetical protein